MNNLKYIFVHGLSGWGSYDKQNEKFPYWGTRSGDLMKQLRERGYDCYSASVHPHKSAYDRACELYAQLTGTRTDYGKNHSEKYGHDRFGPDFTGRPLISEFNEDTRLVILGHSFGGATVRMFAHIMAKGNPEEQDYDCSDYFKGGKADNIFALVALAAPHNGTTAYDMYLDPTFDPTVIKPSIVEKLADDMMGKANSNEGENLHPEDCAAYDMHIDNALVLNAKLRITDSTYYFSQPFNITEKKPDGTWYPAKNVEIMVSKSSKIMGIYSGMTRGGFKIGEDWRPNDGLVNTISETYPFYNPHQQFDQDNIKKGIWNVFETIKGDHMCIQGGFQHKHNVLPYYEKLLKMISELD